MQAKLIVTTANTNKSEIHLKLPTTIGRGSDASITVNHQTISRRHCELYELEGAIVLRDNGSTNGTFFEGERVTERVMRPGEEFSVGPITFRVEYEHSGEFPSVGEPAKAEVPTKTARTGATTDLDIDFAALAAGEVKDDVEETMFFAAGTEEADAPDLNLPDFESPAAEAAPATDASASEPSSQESAASTPAEEPELDLDFLTDLSAAPPGDAIAEASNAGEAELPPPAPPEPAPEPARAEEAGEFDFLADVLKDPEAREPSAEEPVAEEPAAEFAPDFSAAAQSEESSPEPEAGEPAEDATAMWTGPAEAASAAEEPTAAANKVEEPAFDFLSNDPPAASQPVAESPVVDEPRAESTETPPASAEEVAFDFLSSEPAVPEEPKADEAQQMAAATTEDAGPGFDFLAAQGDSTADAASEPASQEEPDVQFAFGDEGNDDATVMADAGEIAAAGEPDAPAEDSSPAPVFDPAAAVKPAEPSKAASKKAKPAKPAKEGGRGWWPFGRKKSAAKPATPSKAPPAAKTEPMTFAPPTEESAPEAAASAEHVDFSEFAAVEPVVEQTPSLGPPSEQETAPAVDFADVLGAELAARQEADSPAPGPSFEAIEAVSSNGDGHHDEPAAEKVPEQTTPAAQEPAAEPEEDDDLSSFFKQMGMK